MVAETVNALLQGNLIDEMIISLIPVLLGESIRFFKDGRPEQQLKLASSKVFKKGVLQMHFNKE